MPCLQEQEIGWAASPAVSNTATIITSSTANDDITGVTERLAARHKASTPPIVHPTADTLQALTTAMLNESANSTVIFILAQIDHLKFAIDWQARREMPGGKKWATHFFKTTFLQDPDIAPQLDGLTSAAIEAKWEQLQPTYKTWYNTARHAISARGRLLRLYNTVRCHTRHHTCR